MGKGRKVNKGFVIRVISASGNWSPSYLRFFEETSEMHLRILPSSLLLPSLGNFDNVKGSLLQKLI